MIRKRLVELTAVAATAAALFGQAYANDSVWISSGSEAGQGAVIVVGSRCVVVTAAHVVGSGGEPLKLVDADRNSADAVVLKSDTALDLAVLEVPDRRKAARDLCSRKSTSIVTVDRDTALKAAGQSPVVWLDKVNSASGEETRIPLSLLSKGQPGHLGLVRVPGSAGQIEPGPGDSGAPVWVSRSKILSAQRLYDREGKPTRVMSNNKALLGIYVGRKQGESVAVPADRVRELVLQALEPVARSEISISPESAKTTAFLRGSLDSKGNLPEQEISAAALNSVAIELDLGRREAFVTSVDVHVAPAIAGTRRSTARPRLDVFSSAYRPAEARDWKRERCASTRTTSVPTSVRCEFSSPKVARGLRIELAGSVSSIRQVAVESRDN
jgi:hypothetical protein